MLNRIFQSYSSETCLKTAAKNDCLPTCDVFELILKDVKMLVHVRVCCLKLNIVSMEVLLFLFHDRRWCCGIYHMPCRGVSCFCGRKKDSGGTHVLQLLMDGSEFYITGSIKKKKCNDHTAKWIRVNDIICCESVFLFIAYLCPFQVLKTFPNTTEYLKSKLLCF